MEPCINVRRSVLLPRCHHILTVCCDMRCQAMFAFRDATAQSYGQGHLWFKLLSGVKASYILHGGNVTAKGRSTEQSGLAQQRTDKRNAVRRRCFKASGHAQNGDEGKTVRQDGSFSDYHTCTFGQKLPGGHGSIMPEEGQ